MKRRRAFTLVELLVVIAIIGILVALLLPAVQAAREAARRMQCSNNVKQVGLAFQLYHDSYRQFPWAGRNLGNCCNSTIRDYWTWAYYILPYMEQQPLYDQTSNAVVYASPVSTYYCPTRRGGSQTYNNTNRIDFAGNAGSSLNRNRSDGVLVRSNLTRVNMAAVTDGTSSTILVGEKQLHLSKLGGVGGHCCDDNEPFANTGWETDVVRHGSRTPENDKKHPSGSSQIFGSRHPAGINVVMVDGSVHHIVWEFDAALFLNLCVRQDGNSTQLDF